VETSSNMWVKPAGSQARASVPFAPLPLGEREMLEMAPAACALPAAFRRTAQGSGRPHHAQKLVPAAIGLVEKDNVRLEAQPLIHPDRPLVERGYIQAKCGRGKPFFPKVKTGLDECLPNPFPV